MHTACTMWLAVHVLWTSYNYKLKWHKINSSTDDSDNCHQKAMIGLYLVD